MKVIRFDTVTSTNDLARDEQFVHGDLLWAEEQTAGRGQRGHTWLSHKGENLTFTLLVEPKFLPAREQFLLSEAAALALVDTLRSYQIEATIKWTNDIYVGDRKIVGMLIEHFYGGMHLRRTLIGIGLNVNQQEFDPSLPDPTSMALERGKTFDREEVVERFTTAFEARYKQLEAGQSDALQQDYRQAMYRIHQMQRFRLPDGTEFEAEIEGVEAGGALQLRHADGLRKSYQFKEVEFVIKKAE